MKIRISGSDIEHHLSPLHASVRQSEGVDYDKTAIAIYDIDGKPNLCAQTDQPSHTVYAQIELNGTNGSAGISGKSGTNGTAEPQVTQSFIASNVETCGDDEYWVVKNSSFTQRNRAAGTDPVDYELSSEQLDIRIGEKSMLHLAAQHRTGHICIPSYDECLNPITGEKPTASGMLQKCVLSKSLKPASNVCRLGGKTSSTKEGSIHLLIYGDSLRVEAFSNKVQSDYINPAANTFDSDFHDSNRFHLSISADAATTLAEIARISGEEAYWIYNREEKQLIVWCFPYVIVIKVEEMYTEDCFNLCRREAETDVTRTELLTALRRVKSAGNTAVNFLIHTSGAVEVTADNGAAETTLPGKIIGDPFVSPYHFRMPVAAMLTIVKDADVKDIGCTFDLSSPTYVVFATDHYTRIRVDTI